LNSMFSDLHVERRDTASIKDEELEYIYHFCNSIMQESFEGFVNHARLYDFLFLFKAKKDDQIVGVSLWRCVETGSPWVRVIIQGKLRIRKEYRRRALHVKASLYYYLRCQLRHPLSSFYFLSIATIFNYVSMRKTVSNFWILNHSNNKREGKTMKLLYPVLDRLLEEDHFTVDEETKAINVYVTIRNEVLNEFPESYFSLPEAQEYIKINPKYRQAHDIAYAYPFNFVNILCLLWRILVQSYLRNWLISSKIKKT